MKYYLIGIKGTGMSALAKVLKDLGNFVMGSDVEEYFFTVDTLIENDIKFYRFNEFEIDDTFIYIISNAYTENNNDEVKKIISNNFKYYYYQDFIENYFCRTKIGVSGTHGKTTTTSIISKFLEDNEIAYLIGDSTGYADKNYQYFIFEACEYKRHFLSYSFDYLMINNIDYDHPDYFKDMDDVVNTFQEAANKAKILIINNDDSNCKKIKHKKKFTYGMNSDCDVFIKSFKEYQSGFDVELIVNQEIHKYFIPFTGFHMVYNFVAAFTCLYAMNYLNINVQEKILTINLPKRRMQENSYYTNVFIDDYAHHPTEINCLISGVKQKYPTKKIVVVFQPHTYSRTLKLKKEFSKCFKNVDELYLASTFTSKREKRDYDKERQVLKVFKDAKRYTKKVLSSFCSYENSVIIFLGAGIISEDIKKIINKNEKIMKKIM